MQIGISQQLGTQISRAIAILRGGGVGAFPTDTVYGLGGSAFVERVVERVFALKARPRHLPLPLLIADKEQVRMVASVVPEAALSLMEAFWPGGLTLVLPGAPSLLPGLRGEGGGVGVRLPAHPTPIALIRGLGAPLIGTSANRSSLPSPITAEEVSAQFGEGLDFLLDGGRCPGGVESTVVDLTAQPRLLREGAIPKQDIEKVLGCPLGG